MKAFSVGLLGAMLLASAQGLVARAATIQFQVFGVRSAEGSVRIDLCTADTFLKDNCPYWGSAPAVPGMTVVVIKDVPAGAYAAQVFHDRNDNHRVDRGFLGIPREDIGFSNDAPLGLQGPRFNRACFWQGDAPQTVTLKLRHFGPQSIETRAEAATKDRPAP
jgi:uncharacterized protein (DUF2141 family)